jgi:hypothetical protein
MVETKTERGRPVTTVNVAKDFTRFPSGRLMKFGNTSGEALRVKFLQPPISRGQSVTVELDDTIGYDSSFLEEAFGGLVRELKIAADDVLKLLTLKSEDSALVEEIVQYMRDAERQIH